MNDKLDRFDLNFFSQVAEDFEAAQYRFFAALDEAEKMIENRYLFPLVDNMVQFNNEITEFMKWVRGQEEKWPTVLKLTTDGGIFDSYYEWQSDAAWCGEIQELLNLLLMLILKKN